MLDYSLIDEICDFLNRVVCEAGEDEVTLHGPVEDVRIRAWFDGMVLRVDVYGLKSKVKYRSDYAVEAIMEFRDFVVGNTASLVMLLPGGGL